ncbi:Orn/Lys/Arg family decarboxylase [Streptomyces sp. NPDC054783]
MAAGAPAARRPAARAPGARLEQAVLPREAFSGPTEQVPAERAAGRISAEMISPCPPGRPSSPGEVITKEVLDYLRGGAAHGFLIADAADPSLDSLRVTAGRDRSGPCAGGRPRRTPTGRSTVA